MRFLRAATVSAVLLSLLLNACSGGSGSIPPAAQGGVGESTLPAGLLEQKALIENSGFTKQDLGHGTFRLVSTANPSKQVTITNTINGTSSFKTSTGVSGTITTRADGSIWLRVIDTNGKIFNKQIASPIIAGRVHTMAIASCTNYIELEDDLSNLQMAQDNFNWAVGEFIATFGVSALVIVLSGGSLGPLGYLGYALASANLLSDDDALHTEQTIYNRDRAAFHCA
uniref:Uncharacterized protein n=1 Tax=mine drainage metagenome TaxID=410659 RepID=E6Q6D4_9ZZZZ